MGKIEWGAWARYQGIAAGLTLVATGVIGCFYDTMYWGIYGIAVGIFVTLWEYPLPGLTYLGFLYSNFWIRGILYIALSGPCYIQTPTISGGIFLTWTGLTFLMGALKGERYRDPNAKPAREERPAPKKEKAAAPAPAAAQPMYSSTMQMNAPAANSQDQYGGYPMQQQQQQYGYAAQGYGAPQQQQQYSQAYGQAYGGQPQYGGYGQANYYNQQ